jgi:hypothetical protein
MMPSCDFVKSCDQRRSRAAQLVFMLQGQPSEDAFAARTKVNINLTPVFLAQGSAYESSSGQPIDQLDRAVMLDLQSFREIRNTSAPGAGHALYSKQELVLLRLKPRGTGCVFAESEKATNLVAKLGYGLVVREL